MWSPFRFFRTNSDADGEHRDIISRSRKFLRLACPDTLARLKTQEPFPNPDAVDASETGRWLASKELQPPR